MPALPAVPNVLRVEIQYSIGTDLDVLTRTFWQYSGSAPTNTGLVAMATTLASDWSTNLRPLCTSAVAKTGIFIVDLSTASSATGSYSSTTTGSRSGGTLPAGTCALINYTVGRRYRGGKPRNYAPFGSDTDLNTPQQWSTTFQSAVNTGIAAFDTALIAAAPSGTTITGQVNVSYYKGFASVQDPVTMRWRNIPTPRTTPVVDSILTSSCNLKIGSQRKRYIR